MSPPPPPREALIAAARNAVDQLIVFARMILRECSEPHLLAGTLRHILRLNIAPAEAILRRAIHLLAAELPPLAPPGPRSPRASAAPVPAAERKAPVPRTPQLRLTESTGGESPAPAPRPALPPSAAPKPEPDTAALLAKLERRITALEAASADPDAVARRLQRLLSKRKPALAPLSPKPPPGLVRMRFDTFKTLYRDLHEAALAAVPANTS